MSQDRVALYARISQDRDGTHHKTDRQLRDARDLAERHGWQIVGEYADANISAFTGAERPQYQALMRKVEAGELDRIVVWQTSRIWRSRTERANAIETLGKHRVSVTAVSGPDLDLSSASGQLTADLLGAFDTAESAIKGERVAAARREMRQRGQVDKVRYGWSREYIHDDGGKVTGWRDVIAPVQAGAIREAAERVIAGGGLGTICRDFDQRGIPTAKGGPWRTRSLRDLLLREINVGRIVHRGQVVADAAFPPILTEDTYRAVRSILTDPGRKVSRGSKRTHLLTLGVGECGGCGADLAALTRPRFRNGEEIARVWKVRCRPHGCTSRLMGPLDDFVAALVIERLSRPDGRALLAAPDRGDDVQRLQDDVDHLRGRLDAVADDYADGHIDSQQLRRISDKLRPQLVEAEADLAEAYRARGGQQFPALTEGRDPAEVWDEMDVGRRRALLEVLGLRVILEPQPSPGRSEPVFDPETVTIKWGSA